MSRAFLSYLFKTNLSGFRNAILTNDTNRICRILDIERGYICKQLDNAGNTALLLAIQYAKPLTIHLLLEQGAHPDQTNFRTFQTPLSVLASTVYEDYQSHEAKIDLEMARILLDHGAYVDKLSPYMCKDEFGKDYIIKETPLMTAVRTRNLPMATLFVDRKANVNYIERYTEKRPIHFSIVNGDIEMFDLLENAGASCRCIVTNGENTLLHWFCYNKRNDEYISLLKRLINIGCDINAENNLGHTPLMLAATLDMINTCQVLLNVSADVNKIDHKGFRAIDLAKMDGECYKLLQQVTHTEQIQTQSHENIDRIVWRKQINLSRSLSRQRSDDENDLNIDKKKLKRHSSKIFRDKNTNEKQNNEEIDTKYQSIWEKLLQSKEKKRRIRNLSSQSSRDSSSPGT